MTLLTSAQLDNYSNRKDKSVTIRFITGEKTPKEVADLHSLIDSYGYLYFKPEEKLTDSEIKELDSLETDLYDNPKTQSQRLRNVLYKNYELNNNGFNDFKEFYKNETEKIIQHYKSKL